MKSLSKQNELTHTKEQQTIDNTREKVMNEGDDGDGAKMNINTIWQPNVGPTDQCVPYPSGGSSWQSDKQHRLYTKTSLHLTPTTPTSNTIQDENELDFAERQRRRLALNREILRASESFNSSPKPFSRQTTLPETSQLKSSTIIQPTRLPFGANSQSFSHHHHQDPSTTTTTTTAARTFNPEYSTIKRQNNIDDDQPQDMAPKLVHNQYNSPIDLYSMNNIRKTIEAHSEIIAPGVKGINFSKLDTPVNKQSEVYKLVMEEEQKREHQAPAPRQTQVQSPISGQPVRLPAAAAAAGSNVQYASGHRADGHSASASASSPSSASIGTSSWSPANNSQLQQQVNNEHRPKCCECGQFIVGPFARLHNRHIHPHCFNCTTCGTSLKNSGYFTINDKLYCDIHAKQVANVMRLNYNFDANSQTTTTAATGNHKQQPTIMDDGGREPLVRQPEQQQPRHQHVSNHFGQQSATISTMFSSKQTTGQTAASTGHRQQQQQQHDDCCDSRQQQQHHVRWSWRPAGDHQAASGDSTAATPSTATMTKISNNMASINSYERQLSSASASSQHQHQMAGHSARLVRHETCLGGPQSGSRTPVCVNCNQHIHGPYILAGERVWCKACSSTQFTCNVCHRSLLNIGFIELAPGRYHCEACFDAHSAPTCSKCHLKVKGDCLNALDRRWHPTCFVCTHCREPFGNSSFYLEDNKPYCQRDWNVLFTTKCFSCSYPIEAGDKWIEAMERSYHSNCFRCSSCQSKLEGSTFYCKAGKPYCRLHATNR